MLRAEDRVRQIPRQALAPNVHSTVNRTGSWTLSRASFVSTGSGCLLGFYFSNVCTYAQAHGGQGIALRSQFSCSIVWVLSIKLKLTSLVQSHLVSPTEWFLIITYPVLLPALLFYDICPSLYVHLDHTPAHHALGSLMSTHSFHSLHS